MTKKPGATGEFPDGKLNENDEGAINIGLYISKGILIVDFGKPVTWLGLPKADALALAKLILDKVKDL